MASSLVLDSLEIRGYRAFHSLRVERLGRVNLIVGKNNVGKSSLLEAIWLYAHQGSPLVIWQILEARDEGARPLRLPNEVSDAHDEVFALKHLFHGRMDIRTNAAEIRIGPVSGQDFETNALSIAIDRRYERIGVNGEIGLERLKPGEHRNGDDEILVLSVGMRGYRALHRLDRPVTRLDFAPFWRCVFTSANGADIREITQLWDGIALTSLEDDVLKALRIIAPEVDRVSLVSTPQLVRLRDRVPIAKIANLDDPVPLRSLGEGMNRLFGIALALVNAKDGILLIDEIESGIHYSVLPKVWRLVFEVAHRLNVQVFATTHSWDCIQAFQEAAQENTEEEGVLIRLRNLKGNIVADPFDERQLSIVTREKIEVR